MAQIFTVFLFITYAYCLVGIPCLLSLKVTSKNEKNRRREEETDIEIEKTFETKGTKEEQEGSIEEEARNFTVRNT